MSQPLVGGARFSAAAVGEPVHVADIQPQPIGDRTDGRDIGQGTMLQSERARAHTRRFDKVVAKVRSMLGRPSLQELRPAADRLRQYMPEIVVPARCKVQGHLPAQRREPGRSRVERSGTARVRGPLLGRTGQQRVRQTEGNQIRLHQFQRSKEATADASQRAGRT